ncbi:MAG TPA: ABC transporter ATP-binding protein [Micromonosporaceae bacterium]|nr:ABC transporter ATP-binding protein [Micromonosporaceae bacterium]
MNIVETHELTKRYGDRAAVDHVSLTVRRGEVYGFLGPNGAGKTTTLRMLLGLVRATSGRATVLGQPPGAPTGLARIGALVEGPGFYPYLSGRANLRVLARYGRHDDVAVEAALELVDLTDRASDRYKSYSLGMKQRLGVAAALLGQPDLLILDEPTNGLDPAGMADMRDLIRTLADHGQTVLLSSHLLGEVQQICDRVGVISGGRLLTESTVAELRGEASLLIRADPLPAARSVAERIVGSAHVSTVDGMLRLATGGERAAELTRALVLADVAVLEVRPEERTLEDAFFEMTHEGATS